MLAIVPANSPRSAKRRLARLLDPDERAALVAAMLADVVDACGRARAVSEVLVVTPDPGIAPAETRVLRDAGHGHAAAVALALGRSAGRDALVVMADCPLVTPASIDALAAAARPVALCPAVDGGTNALALRPAGIVEPAFGVPDGAAVVAARARARGLEAAVVADPLLALDLDTPDDLRALLELGSGTRTGRLLDRTLSASAQWRASVR
ncbi:MAG: 2-phospho-L-lactate guanylyltransferase [Thermoleophilia bacterium]|nr:2-phospho-L-lactate guanylyltransferase [Thermoleophilia bacterium]